MITKHLKELKIDLIIYVAFECQKDHDNLRNLIDIHFFRFFILGTLSFHNQYMPKIKAHEFVIYIHKQEL